MGASLQVPLGKQGRLRPLSPTNSRRISTGWRPANANAWGRGDKSGTSELAASGRADTLVKRILVLYYSQTGDVRRMAESFVQPLSAAGAAVIWEEIRPTVEYPSPWRNVHRFFNVMPECVLGLPPPIQPPQFAADDRFDLIVLAYQVWFLSPSLPVQGLFRTAAARVFRGRKVITISVSRNMWHRASLEMKRLLEEAGGEHIDGVVATHQGPPWATFLTTTRAVDGEARPFVGDLPARRAGGGGRGADGRAGGRRRAAAGRLGGPRGPGPAPRFGGRGSEPPLRDAGARGRSLLSFLGSPHPQLRPPGPPLRSVGIFLFIHFLLLMIVAGIPLSVLTLPLVYPLTRRSTAARLAHLKQPTES